MTRLNNIVLSYLIVEKYNAEFEKGILPVLLIKYICRRTGVKEDTAREYIARLANGILIEGKTYKINYMGEGYHV